VKNINSVSKKMEQKNLELNKSMICLALRILVPTIENCYQCLGLMHGEWTPIPKRLKITLLPLNPTFINPYHHRGGVKWKNL
jgi:GTP pyrophosphokinase